MAFYGISAPGSALTASEAADTIQFYSTTAAAVVSANTVQALAGNDIISLGAQGRTAEATTIFSGALTATRSKPTGDFVLSGTKAITASLVGSATYVSGTTSHNETAIATGAAGGSLIVTGAAIVTGILTSEKGVRSANASYLVGNTGNDSIYLGNSIVTMTSTTIEGGDGDDRIGTYSYVNDVLSTAGASLSGQFTAATYEKASVLGGAGNDLLEFTFTGGANVSATEFNGNGGKDTIQFIASGANFNNNGVFGGGGDDYITANFQNFSATTIAGGGGNDTIKVTATTVISNLFALDTFNTLDTWDGADFFTGDFNAFSSNTIQAGGGNDTIDLTFTADGGNNLVQLNTGDDLLDLRGAAISATTIQGGAGNDQVNLYTGMAGASQIKLGGGNDTLYLSGNAGELNLTQGTIFGGAGADVIATGRTVGAGSTLTAVLGYSAYTESNISAMDTIAVANSGAATYTTFFDMGGLSRGSFSAGTVTGTNGVAQFTATFDNNVTARYEAIDAQATTTGNVVLFGDGSNVNYLFVQGGTDDLVFRLGSGTNGAFSQANAAVALSNSDTVATLTTT